MISKSLLGLMLLATPAEAHDHWADGTPVPEWVKHACCGVSDIHRYTADEVHQDANGAWIVPGYPDPIPDGGANVLGSGDQYYYAFFADGVSGGVSYHGPVYCFFKPLSG